MTPGSAAGIEVYNADATAPGDIVCFSASFHGRTMGALALTYKEQYKTPFAPVMPGAKMATYQDLDSAAKVIKKVKSHHCFAVFPEDNAVWLWCAPVWIDTPCTNKFRKLLCCCTSWIHVCVGRCAKYPVMWKFDCCLVK